MSAPLPPSPPPPPQTRKGALIWIFAISAEALIQLLC